MLSFPCSHCQRVLKAPEEKAGAQTRCPFCKQAVTIPAAPAAASTAFTAVPAQPAVPVAAPVPAVVTLEPAVATENGLAGLGSTLGLQLEKDIGITAAGAVTSLLTVLLLWFLQITLDLSLYTVSACFVIPAGAIISGGLAATGYYWGAKLLGRRPSPFLLVNMLAISLLTFVLIHALTYITIRLFNEPSPEFASFFTYLSTVYSESEWKIQGHNMSKLGAWGYVEMMLEILGFAIGGVAVYGWLLLQPYCETCARYLSKKGKQVRYTADENSFSATAPKIMELVQGQRVQEALDLHAASGDAKAAKDAVFASTFEVRRCDRCNAHWGGFSVQKKSAYQWQAAPTWNCTSFHQGELEVHA